MRPPADRLTPNADLARALERLDGLPLRPLSARAVIDALANPPSDDPDLALPKFLESDPGWMIAGPTAVGSAHSLRIIAGRPWWRTDSAAGAEALERLWMHAVATAGAARRLAAEAGRPDPERFARAGLIQMLGYWAVGAIDPELLGDFLAIPDPLRRADAERAAFGRDLAAVGRDLAARWGLEPLVVASCWLHADATADLNGLSDDPEGLAILQQAHRWAERTPWAVRSEPSRELGPPDPRHRILVAEVQVRCGPGLLDPESTAREETLTRRLASLQIRHDRAGRELASRDRMLAVIAATEPDESAERWAERTARAWCEEPGIASARVVWRADAASPATIPSRPPGKVLRLGQSSAEIHVWPEMPDQPPDLDALIPAWSAWAEVLEERDRRGDRLDHVVSAHRSRVVREESADRASRLAALAEFAAGAGHELNNPLAVILGRAQLLLPRVETPEDARSLRVIISQAQRAHRILRDLMYIARPPAPRPRPCRPDDIVKSCLRDFKPEAEARGIRLVADTRDPMPGWADPDPMRHLLDVLVRNAMEWTPNGGTIRVASSRSGNRLSWVVRDSGRGITPEEGKHLFEPFFCGRQAGRGLGLGLPRAARFVSSIGGELSWKSVPGQGSVFAVHLPLDEPKPAEREPVRSP